MNRRDLLLQQMGISQWQLRRPEVLKGAVNIEVAPHIRLIVAADQPLPPEDPMLQDVLRSAEIAMQECLFIQLNQLDYLHIQHRAHYWLLAQNSPELDRNLNAISQWQSPNLSALKQTPSAKRALWQQIQNGLTN